MDIKELESFKLSDAVKFHDKLNPALWTEKGDLDSDVHDQLMEIARDFMSELGITSPKVEDITISGSNAAYSYTPHSDLDLHVLVDYTQLSHDEIYKELFNAKKTIYNDNHDIKVHGVPVELYVQDSNKPHHSLGEYSLLKNEWIKFPVKRRANFDQDSTRLKYEKLGELIELAIKKRSLGRIEKVLDIIKRYRQAGLDKNGEFGPENLAFKALRKQGLVQKLWDLKSELRSQELSLEDYHPNDTPPGPEFKPTMPKGTVRVDVSDVYDWYKLGQHISNLKGLGKHDFGKGPPSTIMSFGDEDLEHQYIDALKKTGLDTTDIDPVDPNQPPSMKRQKVDPTYNVNETFDKPYKLRWSKGDHGDVDAYTKLPDGNYLSIMFNKGYSQGTKEEAWSVEFFRNNSQEVTGEGDQQRVFATVLSAIQTFIKKYKPNRVFFSASKEVEDGQKSQSRARLYDSLVQRYARAWGFKAFRADTGDKVIYELNKINKDVAEAGSNYYANRTGFSRGARDDERHDLDVQKPSPKKWALKINGKIWSKDGNTVTFDSEAKALKAKQSILAKRPELEVRLLTSGGVAEARRNPEQNRRSGSGKYDLINYAEDNITDKDNWAVSMTTEPKLGINPRPAVSEDTPKGIYFYPLRYFMQMADRDESLPWADNMPYIQLFQYDRSGEMTQQTKVDPAKLKQALLQYCPEEVIQQASEEGDYDGTPYWFIYDCLSRLGKSDETNVIRWNKVLRDLGFTSVYDPGKGWIAHNEPTQGVVLDPRIIEQHKMFDNRNPTLQSRRYDIQGLADAIGWSRYYQRESQLQRIYNHPDEKKVMLDIAKSMLKPFLGKNDKEAKAMGYDQAIKDAADKVIEILKKSVNEASGYIPSEKQKNDPRFKTALTVDVKPDSIKDNAKKLGSKIKRSGIPPILNTNGKF